MVSTWLHANVLDHGASVSEPCAEFSCVEMRTTTHIPFQIQRPTQAVFLYPLK